MFAGCHDLLKVYGWEPFRSHDTVAMGWGKIADIAVAQTQLVSGGAGGRDIVILCFAALYDMTLYGTALYDMTRYGVERYGMKRHGPESDGQQGDLFSASSAGLCVAVLCTYLWCFTLLVVLLCSLLKVLGLNVLEVFM